jgi:Putative beta-barrel porin 2
MTGGPSRLRPSHSIWASALLLAFASARLSMAQGVVAPDPSSIAAALQQAGVRQGQEANAASANGYSESLESPFRWGPLVLQPHFFYRFLYGDGIQASPGHPLVTSINSISPGLLFDAGEHWTFDYTPTWNLYSNSAFRDSVDELARLTGTNTLDDWMIQFVQAYSFSSDPLIETGAQTSEQDYTTSLDLSHAFNDKVRFETTAIQDLQFAVGYPDSYQWSDQNWLHYRIVPKGDIGLGCGVGYVEVSRGMNNAFVRPEVQGNLQATDKLSLSATGGLEYRQFYGHPSRSLDTPIFSASIIYDPFETTKISITAARQVSTSFFQDQSTRSTQFSVSVDQRLLRHFHLTVGVSEGNDDYLASNDALATVRNDNQVSVSGRLSTTFLKRGTLAVLYQGSRNSSSIPGYGYSSGQIGAEIGFKY